MGKNARDPLSVRFYRLLLRVLPKSFRGAYAREMEQAFRSSLRDATSRRGLWGFIGTWMGAIGDLAATASRVRGDMRRARRRGSGGSGAQRLEIPAAADLLADLPRDIRLGVTGLLRNPVFSVAVILTLGVGVGANTATFQVINETLRRPLPYPDSDQLVYVTNEAPSLGMVRGKVSPREAADWQASIRGLDDVAILDPELLSLSGDESGDAEAVPGRLTSYNLFTVLDVEPAIGRAFVPEDDRPGASDVVIMSHGLWVRRYGADPSILGRTINVSGSPHIVIGILPEGFEDPLGGLDEPAGLYATLGLDGAQSDAASRWLFGIGRLRDGTSIEAASQEINAHRRALSAEDPDLYPPEMEVGLLSLHAATFEGLRAPFALALAGVGFVLLIVCANLAALLLARGVTRGREVAIMIAMGASRYRILRMILVESLVLAAAGGAVGLAVAGGISAFVERAASDSPRLTSLNFDLDVFVFVALVSTVCAITFGLLPALSLSKADPQQVLKEGQSLGGGGRERFAQKVLVVTQMSVAFVLMVGSGMVFNSFVALSAVDPGFDREQVVTFEVQLPASRYSDADAMIAFHLDLAESLRALPGVTAVGAVNKRPLGTRWGCSAFLPEGMAVPATNREWPCAEDRSATPGYFESMGIDLKRGRGFRDSDGASDPRVAVVNEALATRLWPGEEAVGKRLRWAWEVNQGAEEREVVGVAENITHISLELSRAPAIYVPYAQRTDRRMTLAVRSSGDPLLLLPSVRAEAGRVDPDLPLRQVSTMDAVVRQRLEGPLTASVFFAVLAGAGLLLSLAGVYALMVGAVATHSREIGLRVALGASRGIVVGSFVKQGARMTAIAVVIGVGGAMLLGQVISSLLFGVEAFAPGTISVAAGLLILVATVAAYLPARRAARIDPMSALRQE